jgi:hypothetical protein
MDVGASQVVLVGAGGRGQILYLILTADLNPNRAQVAAAAATTPAQQSQRRFGPCGASTVARPLCSVAW